MNVKEAESRLLRLAEVYVLGDDKGPILEAAISYGKAKHKARNNRDRWKLRRRERKLSDGTQGQ